MAMADIRTNNSVCHTIVSRVFKEGFVDDHLSSEKEKFIPRAILLFIRGVGCETGVCPAWENTVFSLNPLYIDESRTVHLSMASCGGTVDSRGRSLEKACEVYNKEHAFSDPNVLFSQVILVRREDYLKKFGE